MTMEQATLSWLTLIGLGAFHGINPGMGWLFAVALGMQERRRAAVYQALMPLAFGHALAVGAAVILAAAIGAVAPLGVIRWALAAFLVVMGGLRLFRHHHHPRGTGMRVGMTGLTVWSFLMASAHGAGLMVAPVFLGMTMMAGEAHHCSAATTGPAAFFATIAHAAGYLAVTAVIAALVFEKFGVGLLRRAWFNLDRIWAVALIATGILTAAL
jgi:hypothetical protein